MPINRMSMSFPPLMDKYNHNRHKIAAKNEIKSIKISLRRCFLKNTEIWLRA
jgi:hypothetical protein